MMKTIVIAVALSLASPLLVHALPFNDDMVDTQIKTGQIMRPKAKDTVAMGSVAYHVEKKEDALKLVNPLKGDALSALNGERLFAVNCLPCHGDISKNPRTPGPVAARAPIFLAAPDLSTADFSEEKKSDGTIYATIHFGGLAIMPALGWKFSPSEHWDIINYIRKVQASKAK